MNYGSTTPANALINDHATYKWAPLHGEFKVGRSFQQAISSILFSFFFFLKIDLEN